MKPHFQVRVESFEELRAMPEGMTQADYRTLLGLLEFDGIDEVPVDELGAYVAMALQDLEPEEGAQLVLAHALQGKLTPGQIRNLSEEMKDERQWEENADMRCHEPIFNAQVLLHEAFPKIYAAPDILRLCVTITPVSSDGKSLLKEALSEPLLVRILADGMTERAILRRLFEDQLAKGPFPEASQIIWQYSYEKQPPDGGGAQFLRVTLYSPRYWMGPLEDVESFESTTPPE